jgi:Tol biopolymer transport system component
MRLLVAIPATALALAVAGSGRPVSAERPSVSRIAWAPGPAIVFDRSSNIEGSVGVFLYTRSGPRRLAPGGSPVWSPDGTQIAFDHRQGIALMRADGSGLRTIVRSAVQPRWSPDGRWIAFFFVSRAGVGIVRPDGTGLRQVGILRSDAPDRIAWSPDSRKLAFGADDKGFFVVPIDGSQRQRPRRACPEWGPHGELAFLGKGTVTIVRRNGTKRRIRLASCPVWSPDGTKVVANGPRNPVVASVRSGRRSPIRIRPRADTLAELAWSPDGRRIAFTWPTGPRTGAIWGLYTVSAGGGQPRRLLRR